MTSSMMDSEVPLLTHFLSSGEILPAQMASPSNWSAEKKLAAAVLAGALVEIRDRHDEPAYRRRVQEDLDWIYSGDDVWPYSFLRLCQLFGLDAGYVRKVVETWMQRASTRRQVSLHRHAA